MAESFTVFLSLDPQTGCCMVAKAESFTVSGPTDGVLHGGQGGEFHCLLASGPTDGVFGSIPSIPLHSGACPQGFSPINLVPSLPALVIGFSSYISMKTECDYLNGWIKKVKYAKISPKMVNPRDLAGERRRRRRRSSYIS